MVILWGDDYKCKVVLAMLSNGGFILSGANEAVCMSFKDWTTSRKRERKKKNQSLLQKSCELGTFSLAKRQKLVWCREWVAPLMPIAGFY